MDIYLVLLILVVVFTILLLTMKLFSLRALLYIFGFKPKRYRSRKRKRVLKKLKNRKDNKTNIDLESLHNSSDKTFKIGPIMIPFLKLEMNRVYRYYFPRGIATFRKLHNGQMEIFFRSQTTENCNSEECNGFGRISPSIQDSKRSNYDEIIHRLSRKHKLFNKLRFDFLRRSRKYLLIYRRLHPRRFRRKLSSNDQHRKQESIDRTRTKNTMKYEHGDSQIGCSGFVGSSFILNESAPVETSEYPFQAPIPPPLLYNGHLFPITKLNAPFGTREMTMKQFPKLVLLIETWKISFRFLL